MNLKKFEKLINREDIVIYINDYLIGKYNLYPTAVEDQAYFAAFYYSYTHMEYKEWIFSKEDTRNALVCPDGRAVIRPHGDDPPHPILKICITKPIKPERLI